MTPSTSKRLDELEIYLTPKELAIQFTEEMRKYLSEEDFWNAIAKLEYGDLPWAKAFSKLSRQTEMRCPGNRRDVYEERCKLNEKLQKEYQFLRVLIGRINEIIQNKAEAILLVTALQASRLERLIGECDFARSATAAAAWIKRRADDHREPPLILGLLRSYADVHQIADPRIESLANELGL